MTPEQKAIELVEKFSCYAYKFEKEYGKYCALICVDEILSILDLKFEIEFWEQVKEQIIIL